MAYEDSPKLGSADRHVGTYRRFLVAHRREAHAAAIASRSARVAFAGGLLRRIADPRNLRMALDHLKRQGGSAAGPDGVRPVEISDREAWPIVRCLRDAIVAGQYRVGAERLVRIGKGPGRGTRTIVVQNVTDRIVQRAIVQIVQPFVDPRLSASSFGSRPGYQREHALARAAVVARRQGLWVWVGEDVRDAFDVVPRGRLLDIVRRHVPDDNFLTLLKTVVDRERRRGLRQGGAVSPLLLNLYLDHALDRPWSATHSTLPLIRVVDDLLVLTPDHDAASLASSTLHARLRAAGMPLNPDKAVVRDLSAGAEIEWLGYSLCAHDGVIQARLTERRWDRLHQALTFAHERPDAPLRAVAIIKGWLDQEGPCYAHEDVKATLDRVATVARDLAFEEIPSRDRLRGVWLRAKRRWQAILKDAANETSTP